MPVMVSVGKTVEPRWIKPTSKWKKIRLKRELQTDSFVADRNFYIQTKEIK
jgi:hypothetical protein